MNLLRTSLLWLFCLRLLFPGETVEELFKLPFLVGHYLHHQSAEGHGSVFDFLQEHYGSHPHHDQDTADHQAHHQLPFGGHHTDGLKVPVQPFAPVSGLKFSPIPLPELPPNQLVCLVVQWHSQFSPSIWLPPKIG